MVRDPSECFRLPSVIELFSAENCVDETLQGSRPDWDRPRASGGSVEKAPGRKGFQTIPRCALESVCCGFYVPSRFPPNSQPGEGLHEARHLHQGLLPAQPISVGICDIAP